MKSRGRSSYLTLSYVCYTHSVLTLQVRNIFSLVKYYRKLIENEVKYVERIKIEITEVLDGF